MEKETAMENFNLEDFRVNGPVDLKKHPTRLAVEAEDDEIEQELGQIRSKMSALQDRMYAHNRYSVLICLQGMDTAGKDSLIREVFKEMNPRGIVVHSFKTPNTTELEHDYLWRHYIALPERGKFAIFNRTHYENVLVTRVHPEYILNENLPGIEQVEDIGAEFWERRFQQLVNFEQHIAANGTIVLKFFLHLGKEEQRERLLRRLEEGKHNWKFSPGDLEEREEWEDYQQYYEEAINATSTEQAPWFIVPADNKGLARYIVGQIILTTLERYADIQNPPLEEDVKENIDLYIEQLKEEK